MIHLSTEDTCIFRMFGADSCFGGALDDALLRAVLEALGSPWPEGWSREICLVAPVQPGDPDALLRKIGSQRALRLLGLRADPRARLSPWPKALQGMPLPKEIDLPSTRLAAARADVDRLLEATRAPELEVRREAQLGLAIAGHPVRVAGWTEGGFLHRARAHPWGSALLEGRADPSLAALLALHVDADIQPRVLFVLAGLPKLHPTFEALAADTAGRTPLRIRRHAAAALILGGATPADPVLHRVLLADLPGDEPDLLAIAIQDPDAEVRLGALRALKRAKAMPARALRRLAEMDPDPEVRALLEPLELDPLSAALVPRPHASRGAGLERLAELDPQGAAMIAAALVQDGDPELGWVAARVVGAATPPERARDVADRALSLLDYQDWARRRIGVALLGALPLTGDLRDEISETLEHLARHDPDPDVQQEARAAMEALCED